MYQEAELPPVGVYGIFVRGTIHTHGPLYHCMQKKAYRIQDRQFMKHVKVHVLGLGHAGRGQQPSVVQLSG